jgi:hypothetical protein
MAPNKYLDKTDYMHCLGDGVASLAIHAAESEEGEADECHGICLYTKCGRDVIIVGWWRSRLMHSDRILGGQSIS